eukprot:5076926-Pleurochrysis_carterae.AAC.4
MSLAPKNQSSPLRMLARLTTICLTLCVHAAAFASAHTHLPHMLLLAVFYAVFNIYLPAYTHYASAYVSHDIPRLIETRASAAASASAIAITFALAGASKAISICTFAVSVSAATRLSRSLLAPAASLVTIIVAVVASSIVAYDRRVLGPSGKSGRIS